MSTRPPLRVVVVDDEPLARDNLRLLIGDHPNVTIVGEAGTGADAVAIIRATRPDVAFLDVRMPRSGGFDVLDRLAPEERPFVVFVTAFGEYAIRAFDSDAVDYLHKPFDDARFDATIRRVEHRVRERRQSEIGRRVVEALELPPAAGTPTAMTRPGVPNDEPGDLARTRGPAPRPVDRIVIREVGRAYYVRPAEIVWLEAEGSYVRLHTATGSHLYRGSLARLLPRLDPDRFVRVHRTAAVSLDHVQEIQPYFHGDYVLILRNGVRLRVSRRRPDAVRRLLGRG